MLNRLKLKVKETNSTAIYSFLKFLEKFDQGGKVTLSRKKEIESKSVTSYFQGIWQIQTKKVITSLRLEESFDVKYF